MKIWLTSDTHFGHKKIIELSGRPENFEEIIFRHHHIKNIQDDDVVIHLGDVALYKEEFWHKEFLKGFPEKTKKWLIKGNHERRTDSFYLKLGWDFVGEKIILSRFGRTILFSHVPKEEKTSFWDLNIHGHLHNKKRRDSFSVIKEVNNFLCLSKNHILIEIEEKFSILSLENVLRQTHNLNTGSN